MWIGNLAKVVVVDQVGRNYRQIVYCAWNNSKQNPKRIQLFAGVRAWCK